MGRNEMKLTGLDIETTGTDINKNHRLIQVGIVLPNGEKLSADVRPVGDIMIQAEAMKVNGFTLARIGDADLTHVVDDIMSADIRRNGYKHGDLTPVGWNVGAFDMAFMKKEMPKTAAYFSYRAMDLTALAIAYELRTGKSRLELKQRLAKRVAKKLGRDERHDALYDAEAALVCLNMLLKV